MASKVVMAEATDIYHDYRVQKEAATLVEAGYEVTVYGFRSTLQAPTDVHFPFKLHTLPIFSRQHRTLRTMSMVVNIAIINLIILLTRAQFYHGHNTMFLFGMHLSSRLRGKWFIYDAHEVQWEHGRPSRVLEETYIHHADAIINVSPGRIRVCSERFGIPQEHFTLVSNYPIVDSDVQYPPPESIDTLRLIFSGGFDLLSNRLDLLLPAMVEVPGVDLYLMAFGYRDGGQVMRTLTSKHRLEDRVHWLPLVRPDEVMANVAKYDVAVNLLTNPQNHVSIRYCSTNKMYEYLAAGMAVLSSDIESFVEEFGEPGAALTVNAESVDAITGGLRELTENRDKLVDMRKTALRLSRERFNWATQEANLVDMYRSLQARKV
ncbi:glycosyltransferase family 4 protein [bacterium]|nr:glycosyltransferase family 4 protein [bacterium]